MLTVFTVQLLSPSSHPDYRGLILIGQKLQIQIYQNFGFLCVIESEKLDFAILSVCLCVYVCVFVCVCVSVNTIT